MTRLRQWPWALFAGLLAAGATARAEPATKAEPAAVQRPAKPDKDGDRRSALGGLGGNSKEPIKIDADRLDVFDRENRAVFKGNVVAVQGETTIHCTALTVFYERGPGARAATPPEGQGDSAIKKIDCQGPVTVTSKDQVATGNNAVFDRVANKVVLTGNAALTQGQNVTRGERIVYDLNTGVANIEGGRVRAMFVPTGKEEGSKRGSSTAASGSAEPKPRPKERVQAN